jgi:hypothetical protein
MRLHDALYRAARYANTAHAIANPKRLPTRVKNIAVGRLLARAGVWKIWR